MDNDKWDLRYLDLSKFISNWSKDPSTRVGAVITRNNRIVSMGYNGFPQGVDDDHERYNDRDTKYKMIVHGEANAIVSSGQNLEGCTLYTYPFQPCSTCAGLVIQSGIKRVVTFKSNDARWAESFAITRMMFDEAGVALDFYDL